MKNLRENRIGLGGVNSDGPLYKRHEPEYISGYNSGGYASDSDTSHSRRLSQLVYEDDLIHEEDEEIRSLNELAIRASLYNLNSRSAILEAAGTDIITEGALIEMGKTALADVVKDLLSAGAVVITGGFGGDTIVDILYAIERTKEVLDLIDAIKQGSKIVMNFFNKMQNIKLENNLDEIKTISLNVIAELAHVYDDAKGGISSLISTKAISEARESVKLIQKVKEVFNELREKMLEFAKSSISSIADWISAFIPDDGGLVGSAIKVTLVGAIEALSGKPFTTLKTAIAALPGDFSKLALSESKLKVYLEDLCNQIADGIEKFSSEDGYTEMGAKALTGTVKKGYELIGDYVPGAGTYMDIAGGAAQAVGDFIGGEDSTIGKVGKAMFDPRYASRALDKIVKFGFDELPKYIREKIIPRIPDAVDFYARMMVYMSSFASLIESLASGELERYVEKFDPKNVTKKEKGSQGARGLLDMATDFFTDQLASKESETKSKKALSENFKLIAYYDGMLLEGDEEEEEDSSDEINISIEIDEISSGGVPGVSTPLGTNSKGKVPSDRERKNRMRHAIGTFGGN